MKPEDRPILAYFGCLGATMIVAVVAVLLSWMHTQPMTALLVVAVVVAVIPIAGTVVVAAPKQRRPPAATTEDDRPADVVAVVYWKGQERRVVNEAPRVKGRDK